MIKVNFVGGPWHGQEREEDPKWEWEHPMFHVQAIDPDDDLPRHWTYRSLGWQWMFWPGTITYIAPGLSIMKAFSRVTFTDELVQRTSGPIVAMQKDKAWRHLQRDLDAHLYERPPLSPIIRSEDEHANEIPGMDSTVFTARAHWIYAVPEDEQEPAVFLQ